ncbi:MAG: hypothetical protein KDC95_23495 [Planctomycetes bacterium]|nr:hypothetical protein [Planctomycetota bacterium]
MRSRSLSALLLTLTALSCQRPDLSGVLLDHEDMLNDRYGAVCECPTAAGFASLADCDDAFVSIGEEHTDCMADALAGHETEGQEYLECANSSLMNYIQCLDANDNCEESKYQSCTDTYESAISTCSSLPADVKVAFDACIPY